MNLQATISELYSAQQAGTTTNMMDRFNPHIPPPNMQLQQASLYPGGPNSPQFGKPAAMLPAAVPANRMKGGSGEALSESSVQSLNPDGLIVR